MANKADRVPENVLGRFYHDSTCLDCDLCRSTAAANFRRNIALGRSYVFKQPETAEELARCRQAVEECPTESIGMDGEESLGGSA